MTQDEKSTASGIPVAADDSAISPLVVDADSTVDSKSSDEALETAPISTEAAPTAEVTEPSAASDEKSTSDSPAESNPASPNETAAPKVDIPAETPPAPAVESAESSPQAPDASNDSAASSSDSPAAKKPPRPRPRPRPKPRPIRADAAVPAVPTPPVDAAEHAEAATWGRVDDDGTVWVRESGGERSVGQYPGAGSQDALGYFVRKYLDLLAQVKLFEARLDSTDLSIKEIDSTLSKLGESLKEPAVVGDLDGLRAKLDELRVRATEKRKAVEAVARQAKKQALAERIEMVERAEALAKIEPERVQWRQAGDEFRKLLDSWKTAQANGPRIDRPSEESLWKRFSQARTTFDRQRRHFFAALEERNAAARTAKEKLVAEAEKLSSSTDWGVTVGAFRDLMTRWKAAGHAGRKDDDALWARFRAAQDLFFDARNAANARIDAEYQGNLEAKLALLDEVEKLVPVTDLAAAKTALRRYQDQWDQLGKVPRADMQRVEARMRAVEQAIRAAEDSVWKKSNPETKARAEGLAAQLQDSIAGLEADLATATAKGDRHKIEKAEQALEARRAWLAQALAASDEFSG